LDAFLFIFIFFLVISLCTAFLYNTVDLDGPLGARGHLHFVDQASSAKLPHRRFQTGTNHCRADAPEKLLGRQLERTFLDVQTTRHPAGTPSCGTAPSPSLPLS
jgi:hypothetical protein